MFDRIADRYDLLNRLLSFNQDIHWRRRMADHLPPGKEQEVLDLATGTADQLLSLFSQSDRIASAIGIDRAERMLERGRRKITQQHLEEKILLKTGDVTAIPFEADRFDTVTISFGIRNVDDLDRALHEIYRVLKRGGRVLILEFSLPKNAVARAGYLFYLRTVLPKFGSIVSGDRYAYRYLSESIEAFPYGETFCNILRKSGFIHVKRTPLTFGVVTIYQGDKPK